MKKNRRQRIRQHGRERRERLWHGAVVWGGLMVASLASPSAQAQQVQTEVYAFRDTYLTPDITDPSSYGNVFIPMYGEFEWTYAEGDFANGVGRLLWLDIPEWNFLMDALPAPLEADIGLMHMDIFLPGEWDLFVFQIDIVFNEPLAPGQYATIDTVRSRFDIDVLFQDRAGHVSLGWVDTADGVCAADMNHDGALDFFDISAFLSALSDGDANADFHADGVFNFFDVSAFLDALSAGCP